MLESCYIKEKIYFVLSNTPIKLTWFESPSLNYKYFLSWNVNKSNKEIQSTKSFYQINREREWERERERERDWQREWERDRERDREKESERARTEIGKEWEGIGRERERLTEKLRKRQRETETKRDRHW